MTGVGFSLHHDKSIIWSKTAAKTVREAVGQVLGIGTLELMQYAEASDDSGRVRTSFLYDAYLAN